MVREPVIAPKPMGSGDGATVEVEGTVNREGAAVLVESLPGAANGQGL